MAKHHNPRIVTSGLAFAYDMGNDKKSWKGAPTTNLLLSPSDFTSGNWTKTMNSGTVPSVTTETILDRNGNIKAVDKLTLPTDGTYPRIYQSWTPASTATHTFSIWMKSAGGSNLKCEIVVFRNSPWASPSGIITANLTSNWQRFTVSFTPLDTTAHQIYIGSHDTAKGAIIYMDDAQLEVNSFATPFVNGTRTNIQALLDLTNTNTITPTNITYNSDGSFSFNGTNSSINFEYDLRTNWSFECWAQHNVVNGFCFLGQGPATLNNGLHIWFRTDSIIRFGMYGNDTDSNTLTTSTGVWYHYVFTYNHSTFQKSIYRNGVLVGQGTQAQYTGTGTARIGSIYSSGDFTTNGKISNANLYSKVLTAAEISQNFNALRGRFGI